MLTRGILICLVLAAAFWIALPARAIMITFEEGVDGQPINTQYGGVTFLFEQLNPWVRLPWVYCDVRTNHYNATSLPTYQTWNAGCYWMYEDFAAFCTIFGNRGRIDVNADDATYFEVSYCAASDFYLEAYNAAGVLLDVDVGPLNLRCEPWNGLPGTLRVDAPGIAYVVLHDSGNYWEVDNVVTDAGGIDAPFNLQVLSFTDLDGDGAYGPGETFLPGRDFLIEGPGGFSEVVTTGPSGCVSLFDMELGLYAITDLSAAASQYTPAVSASRMIEVIEGETAVALFGVVPVPEPASLMLVGLSGIALVVFARRRR